MGVLIGRTTAQNPFFLERRRLRILIALPIILLFLVFSGCSTRKSSPEGVVESYLTALVEKDETTLTTLTCGDWEEQALLEYDSFSSVKTSLEELKCQATDEQDNQVSVNCSGKIDATYGNETRQFDLQDRVYNVERQGDNWLVCGFERK